MNTESRKCNESPFFDVIHSQVLETKRHVIKMKDQIKFNGKKFKRESRWREKEREDSKRELEDGDNSAGRLNLFLLSNDSDARCSIQYQINFLR